MCTCSWWLLATQVPKYFPLANPSHSCTQSRPDHRHLRLAWDLGRPTLRRTTWKTHSQKNNTRLSQIII